VVVLEHGRVVEQGTQAELLAADSRYSYLRSQQFAPPIGTLGQSAEAP
jgi:ABC-type multidrug transport system fused ATPase/permease subunit